MIIKKSPIYKAIVENTIRPNQMLNADTKNTIAITISTRVGIIENNM